MCIKVESFKPQRLIRQCSKCQLIGHTKMYCSRPTRCVKGAGSHQLSSCPRPRAEPATCANCAGAHPANFCGCKAFVAKQPKLLPKAVDEIHCRASTAWSQTTNGKFLAAVVQQNSISTPPTTMKTDSTIASIHTLLKQMSEQINLIPAFTARIAQLEQNSSIPSTSSRQPTENLKSKRKNG